MGKIIKLKNKNDNVIEFLEDAIKQVKEYNIDNIMIAMKLKDGEHYVMTGYCNLQMAEKQELVGHVQIDIIDEMIRQNYTTS